jgi:hypothetical protein
MSTRHLIFSTSTVHSHSRGTAKTGCEGGFMQPSVRRLGRRIGLVGLAFGAMLVFDAGHAGALKGTITARLFKMSLPPGWKVVRIENARRGKRWVIENKDASIRARITAHEKNIRRFDQEIEHSMNRLLARTEGFVAQHIGEEKGATGDRRFAVMGTRRFKPNKMKNLEADALLAGVLMDLPRHKAVLSVQISVTRLDGAEKVIEDFFSRVQVVKK